MELVDLIYSTFHSDPLINELGIILPSSSDDKTPSSPILLTNHKLGISMIIIKPLFSFLIQQLTKKENYQTIQTNHLLIDKFTFCSLLIKGDFLPAINLRKQLLVDNNLQVENELHILQVILSKHSKSSICWNYRKFCINFLLQKDQKNEFSLDLLWVKELELSQRMVEIYSRNYYAWNYKLFIIQFLNKDQVILPFFLLFL